MSNSIYGTIVFVLFGSGPSHLLAQSESATAQSSQQPRLINERLVFPANDEGWRISKNTYQPMMRLSPDGTHLFYLHRQDDDRFALMLRELGRGKERRIPIAAVGERFANLYPRINPFDPSGRRMVLPMIEESDPEQQQRGPQFQLCLWNIDDDKTAPTGLKGSFVLAKFNRRGDGLIVLTPDGLGTTALPQLKPRPLFRMHHRPVLWSHCPTEDLLCLFVIGRDEQTQRTVERLLLIDAAMNKQHAELPLTNGFQLDDLETRWTDSGRYVYYGDQGHTVRVWDRVAQKEAAQVKADVPMGPGPTPTTMVLKQVWRNGQVEQRIILHDASTDQTWRLGSQGYDLQDSVKDRIVYLKHDADGSATVHAAEIQMPKI